MSNRFVIAIVAAILAANLHSPVAGQDQNQNAAPPADNANCPAEDQPYLLNDISSPNDTEDHFRATGFITAVVCGETVDQADWKPLAGHYTRWVVEQAPLAHLSGERVYSMETRRRWRRLISDSILETSYLLEIAMSAPNVNFTIPLSSFKYNEDSENGTEYTTNLRNNAFNQTFFRVDPNTTTNILARAQSSSRTSYSGATDVLSAVQNVVTLVAPSSTLLTSVNADQVSSTSNAISTIASSLFDNTYNETVEDGFSLERWHEKMRVLILIKLPHEITSHRRNADGGSSDRPVYLSYWLRLSCPRISMFSPRSLCDGNALAPAQPTTGSILGFQMAANKSIQQHLDDQQWYREFLTSAALRTDNEDEHETLMVSFCRSVAIEFYGAGFNAGDARLIVQAVIEGMPELSRISPALRTHCGGANSFGLSRLTG